MPAKKFPGFSFWSWLIGTLIVILTVVVAITVWAMTEHNELKDFTIQQDNVIKREVMEQASDKFVPKEDFSRLEERMKNQSQSQERMEKKIDKIYDKIHERPRTRNRPQ